LLLARKDAAFPRDLGNGMNPACLQGNRMTVLTHDGVRAGSAATKAASSLARGDDSMIIAKRLPILFMTLALSGLAGGSVSNDIPAR
jgi:hypothetical protein